MTENVSETHNGLGTSVDCNMIFTRITNRKKESD